MTASLIYVGIQTKQNVRHTRALVHQGTAARTTNLLLGFMNPESVKAWIEGNGGTPTPELIRQRQFYYQCGAAMVAIGVLSVSLRRGSARADFCMESVHSSMRRTVFGKAS